MNRRKLFLATFALVIGRPAFSEEAEHPSARPSQPLHASAQPASLVPQSPHIEVYKSAGCGCCEAWVRHLEENGFKVTATNVPNPSDYREKLGIPKELGSCHTGIIQGYAIEGHVPSSEIKRLLAERPKAVGLAVPAMPMGSPGMESAHGAPYDVLLVQADGRHSVYRHYTGSELGQGEALSTSPKVSTSPNLASGIAEGEILKIDKKSGRLTIKHGPLTNLHMPAMTMTFLAQDLSILSQAYPGDKISFVAKIIEGKLFATQISVTALAVVED